MTNIFKVKKIRWLLLLYDVIVVAFSSAFFFLIYKKSDFTDCLINFGITVGLLFIFRMLFNVYTQIWRFGGIQCYLKLLIADGIAFLFYYFIARFVLETEFFFPFTLAYYTTTLLISLFMRMVYRYAYKYCSNDTLFGRIMLILLKTFSGTVINDRNTNSKNINIAIIGAGRVGVSFAQDLITAPNSVYTPKMFIDISKEKVGRQIFGLPVFSEESVNENLLAKYQINEFVLSLPKLSPDEKKDIYEKYSRFGLVVKTYDYATTQNVNNGKKLIRHFDIEELLFRKSLKILDDYTVNYYKDKVVLITGGGGSIGSELCRQIASMRPKQLIILDVYENGAYDVQQDLNINYNNEVNIVVEIVSVCNREGLECVFKKYKPQIVLNAAAHKHVPLMENNPIEAIENNIFGTLNTVELSKKYKVEHFIMVSTDKAVNPTNVMGATKRMCEMICFAYSIGSTTIFSATRFGNVLGSAGSVIPLFKKQISTGGPIRITDKRIVRYFMTIPEASQLVLTSGRMAKNGELFVLDMGKPIKILDLAENMIKLSGYIPYKDIDIVETGLRPGEKLYEELLIKSEDLSKTDNDLIFIEKDEPISMKELEDKLNLLKDAVSKRDNEKAVEVLRQVVPTFLDPLLVNSTAEKAEEMKLAKSTKNLTA